MELSLNLKLKIILNNFSKKRKNSLYFYNRVFIPLEITKYDYSELKTTNKEIVIYQNNNVTTKTNDLINIEKNKKIQYFVTILLKIINLLY